MLLPEGLEVTVGQLDAPVAVHEARMRGVQQRPLQAVQRAEVHGVGRQGPQRRELLGAEQARADQRLQVDEVRVAGKGRETLVR